MSTITRNASNTVISAYTYAYDANHRVTTHTYSSTLGTTTYSGTKTYTYDSTSQVIGDTGSAYSYDDQGNRTMAGYATGSANRLSNDGVFTYSYDAEGNLTSKSKGTGLEGWTYTWDNRDRLSSATKTSNGSTVTLAVTYTYDANDKLVSEAKWKTGVGVVTTRRHWDGEDLWAVTDASNVVATRFLYADGVDAVQGRIVETGTNAGTQGFYATDSLGSVRDIIRASTGAIAYHADYDAFGTATEYGTGFGDTLKYTAREYDADTGLQYNRARWYDAKVGRWLSEDPIGFSAGDHNLYRYVSNAATNAIDPSGLIFFAPVIAPGAGYAVGKWWAATSEQHCVDTLNSLRDRWKKEGTIFAANLLDWYVNGNGGRFGTPYEAKASDIQEIKNHGNEMFKKFIEYYIWPSVRKGKLDIGDKFTMEDDKQPHGGMRTRFCEPSAAGNAQGAISWSEPVRVSDLNLFRAFGGVGIKMSGEISSVKANKGNGGAFIVIPIRDLTLKNIRITLYDHYVYDSKFFANLDSNYNCGYSLHRVLKVRKPFDVIVNLDIDEIEVSGLLG